MNAIPVGAPAKINLFLEILGRRPDGYHALSSVFQQISLQDVLTGKLRVAPGRSFACSDPSLPTDGDNLVMKAVRLFDEAYGAPPGLRLHLRKNVPVGAGLGGGSSDAAAALKLLWRIKSPGRAFPARDFLPITRKLGADVSFFLRGGRAKATGIGHHLTPLPQKKGTFYWFVLVFPRVFVSTREVYARLRFPLTKKRSSLRLEKMLAAARPAAEWAGLLFNRLESVVLPRVPAVRRAKDALVKAGCSAALMSGSGSSVFGVAGSSGEAVRIQTRLSKDVGDTWVVRSI